MRLQKGKEKKQRKQGCMEKREDGWLFTSGDLYRNERFTVALYVAKKKEKTNTQESQEKPCFVGEKRLMRSERSSKSQKNMDHTKFKSMISKVYLWQEAWSGWKTIHQQELRGCSELKEETGLHHIALHLSDSLKSGDTKEEQGRWSLRALRKNWQTWWWWWCGMGRKREGTRIGRDHCAVVAQTREGRKTRAGEPLGQTLLSDNGCF